MTIPCLPDGLSFFSMNLRQKIVLRAYVGEFAVGITSLVAHAVQSPVKTTKPFFAALCRDDSNRRKWTNQAFLEP